MCGRFAQLPIEIQTQLLRAFDGESLAQDLAALEPRYNLAPTQLAGVLVDTAEGILLDRLRWGLLPFWAKDTRLAYKTINARAETVAQKPSYREAFKHRRAVVPMAGYYEWTQPEPGFKQPWFLHRVDSGPLWAAGLWEPRHKAQAEDDGGTFTVITTTAQDAAGEVHDRMPVFLPAEHIRDWLREDVDAAQERLVAFMPPTLNAYPVSRRVNAPKLDDPSLLDAIEL